MLRITAINGNDLTRCHENDMACKNSYPCKADNGLKCGIGCEDKGECQKGNRYE